MSNSWLTLDTTYVTVIVYFVDKLYIFIYTSEYKKLMQYNAFKVCFFLLHTSAKNDVNG